MRPKHTLTLALMVVIIGAVIFITSRSDYTPVTKTAPAAVATLSQIAADKVREIKLTKAEKELVLVRGDSGWSVPASWGHAADAKRVDGFLAGLKALGGAERRAAAATSHENFEVDDAKGCRVELGGDGAGLPARFVIGKSDGFDRCFLRIGAEQEVYSVQPNLVAKANLYGGEIKAKDWLDLTVFDPSPTAKLSEMILTTAEGVIHLKRREAPPAEAAPASGATTEGAATEPSEVVAALPAAPSKSEPESIWDVISPEAFEVEESAARNLTGRATRVLRGDDVVDPARIAEYGLDPPERQVEMVFADGARVQVRFGSEITEEKDGEKKGTGRFYLQRTGDQKVFTTQSWGRDGYFKKLSELRPLPPKEEKAESTEPPSDPSEESPEDPAGPPVDD